MLVKTYTHMGIGLHTCRRCCSHNIGAPTYPLYHIRLQHIHIVPVAYYDILIDWYTFFTLNTKTKNTTTPFFHPLLQRLQRCTQLRLLYNAIPRVVKGNYIDTCNTICKPMDIRWTNTDLLLYVYIKLSYNMADMRKLVYIFRVKYLVTLSIKCVK